VAQKAGLSRAEATEGVEQRLAATVAAAGLRVEPLPAQFLRIPEETGGRRTVRGGRLPETGDDVFTAVAELWRDAGCRVSDQAGLDGRMLVVDDPAGYRLTVTRQEGDEPILTVASPPLPVPYLDRGLLAGLAAGLATGCLGPCLTSVAPSAVIPALAGAHAGRWAWVPLFLLVVAVTLCLPETRRFGAGLLVGGGLLGVVVAGVFGG
jgi:hypothetical protein